MPPELRLCGSVGRLRSKIVIGNLFAVENSPKVSVLEPDSSWRGHDSIISHEFSTQKVRQKDFFKNFGAVAF
jgi:hypothetical protein